ncbi:MAG: hypothetical protein ABW186_10890 [Rhodanobacteraceae bacterium]
MNSNLKALITAALLSVSLGAAAQATDQATQPSTTPQTNHKDPADPSKGQDLVNPATSKDTNPTTVGQDKSSGNNLVQPKTKSMTMGMKPDFRTIDTKNHGYVMASEANTPWLKENFAKCDADGDGKVTKSEYETCSKQ